MISSGRRNVAVQSRGTVPLAVKRRGTSDCIYQSHGEQVQISEVAVMCVRGSSRLLSAKGCCFGLDFKKVTGDYVPSHLPHRSLCVKVVFGFVSKG